MDDRPISADLAAQLATMQPRLYGYLFKRLADRDQTLEVLQRVNLVICEKAADFSPGTNFTAWAFTIARFQLLAWRKAQARSRLVFTDSVDELLDGDAAEEAKATDARLEALRKCLQKLRPQDLALIQQRYRDSLSIAAIAATLAKSADAIGMRLSRLRHRLSVCIESAVTTAAHDGEMP